MKLPDEISVWTRETLVGLEGESTTVAFFSGGDMSSIPPRTEGMWQFAVDMIYRFVVCELVEPELFVEGHDNNWFLATIRTISPYVRNGGFFWNGTFVKATDKLRDMTNAIFQNRIRWTSYPIRLSLTKSRRCSSGIMFRGPKRRCYR